MSLQEHIYSVLIVSAADAFNSSIRPLFPESKFSPVIFESDVSSARRILLERPFDFVVINSPLPDDSGTRFAIDACASGSSIALLIVRNELYASTYDKVSPHGVYVLPKPTSKPVVSQALDWMIATRFRLKKLEKKSVSIEEKMQEIRSVNHAKWLLIERTNMSESDAHRYIEKQAMDRCVSRQSIAEAIIAEYE